MLDRSHIPPAKPRIADPRQRELDTLTKWSVVVLILVGLLTAAYTIIHYAARIEETQIQLSSTLPTNYRDTLKALLVSAGAQCPKVCDLTATHAAPDRTTFRVRCGAVATGDACAQPQYYSLALEAAPTPSR